MPTAAGYANISCKIVHTGMLRPAFVTFGVKPSATDPNTVASQVAGAWSATGSMKDTMDTDTTLTQVIAHYGVDGLEDTVGLWTTAVNGTLTFASTPANVALVIQKVTARGGRRGRGRMYLPWAVASTFVNELGVITPSTVTSIQTVLTTFLGALASATVPMYVLHRPSGGGVAHPTTPGPPNLVTSLSLESVVGTQRRRLR